MKTQKYFSKKMLASAVAIIFSSALLMQTKAQTLCHAGYTSAVSGTSVLFTNTSNGGTGSTNYSWDFGDGNYATTATPQSQTHNYAYNGAYTVCLFMADSDSVNTTGCWSNFCDTIVITGGNNPPCQASFSYYSDSSNTSPGVSFYDQSANAVSWAWDFGDGNNSTQQYPVHQYANAGTYTVCLTIVNSFSSTCTYCSPVNYYPCNSVAGYTFNNANDPQISFTNTSTGGFAPYYYWDFGDGNTATSVNATNTYQYSGTYNVCLYMRDSLSSCNASYCTTVTITNAAPQPCSANFYSYLDSLNTLGGSISFYDASTGGPTSWSWNFGDGNTSTLQNPVHQYAQPGTYSVCLTIVTPAGTCSYCSNVTISNPTTSCGASLYLVPDSSNALLWYVYPTVTGTAPFTYLWNFGDGNTSTQASPSHTYASAGHYLVCLTITDANGCSSSTCDSTYKLMSPGMIKDLVVVNPLAGIEENSVSVNSIFPNPANDMLEVSLSQMVKGTLVITDMTGRQVYEEKINAANVRVNVSTLTVGCYNLSVASGTKTVHSKIMIVR